MKKYYHLLEDKFLILSVLLRTDNIREFEKCYELLTGNSVKAGSGFAENIIKDEPYSRQFKKRSK